MKIELTHEQLQMLIQLLDQVTIRGRDAERIAILQRTFFDAAKGFRSPEIDVHKDET